MIKDLLQQTLDDVLLSKNIYSFDQRKTGIASSEYIVYSLSGDTKENFADDKNLIKHTNLTVKYYYHSKNLDDYKSKCKIRETEKLIENALEDAGFYIPFGKFDGGNIDDNDYLVTIFECEYWEVL